jgi:O-antigen/teichoic acid export membrane protein
LQKTETLGKEFFWIISGQTLAILGALVGVRLMTAVLNPASYGELALAMTMAMLTHQVIWGPLGQALSRFFAPAQEASKVDIYVKAVRLLIKQATFLFFSLAGLVCLGLWPMGYKSWLGLVAAAFLFALISGYNSNLNGIQNAARHRTVVAWHQATGTWLRFLLAVALISFLGSSSNIAMLGYCLAALVVFASQIFFFNRQIMARKTAPPAISQDEVQKWRKEMLAYGWPFATWGLLTWGQMASDRWALQFFGWTSDVGLYAVLYQLGYYPILMLSGLVTQLLAPLLFSWAGDARDESRLQKTRYFTKRLILGALTATALGTLLALLFHQQIFFWLAAPKYRGVSSLLPLMVLAGGLFASGQVASLLITTDIRTHALIAPKIFTAILGIMLNFAGAYFLGLPGVVWAGLVFSLSYFFWIINLNRPKCQRVRSG